MMPPHELIANHNMFNATPEFYSTADLREAAQRRLPRGLFEFMDRGNDDEIAMRDNVALMQAIKLVARVLNDVSVRDIKTTLFGKTLDMPVIVSPTGDRKSTRLNSSH